MNNARQETVADIVREMRIGDLCAADTSASRPEYINDFLASYADRIEAAAKREREATTEKSSKVGTDAEHKCECDKYKEHINELNRQILILKNEREKREAYLCGYDPAEALVMQCSTCRFFEKKYSHCKLHDSLTNAKYKCSGWKFKTNKECADEYKSELNR